jgi:hypothetical protein
MRFKRRCHALDHEQRKHAGVVMPAYACVACSFTCERWNELRQHSRRVHGTPLVRLPASLRREVGGDTHNDGDDYDSAGSVACEVVTDTDSDAVGVGAAAGFGAGSGVRGSGGGAAGAAGGGHRSHTAAGSRAHHPSGTRPSSSTVGHVAGPTHRAAAAAAATVVVSATMPRRSLFLS